MIDNIKDAEEQIKDFFVDDKELKEAIKTDEPHDMLSELADNNVDVYTTNLFKWVAEDNSNIFSVEEAINEFGFPKDSQGKPDLTKALMQGQYHANHELLREAWEELKA